MLCLFFQFCHGGPSGTLWYYSPLIGQCFAISQFPSWQLIGPPGVGKTAILEGLTSHCGEGGSRGASRLFLFYLAFCKKCPNRSLNNNKCVLSIDPSTIMAGSGIWVPRLFWGTSRTRFGLPLWLILPSPHSFHRADKSFSSLMKSLSILCSHTIWQNYSDNEYAHLDTLFNLDKSEGSTDEGQMIKPTLAEGLGLVGATTCTLTGQK